MAKFILTIEGNKYEIQVDSCASLYEELLEIKYDGYIEVDDFQVGSKVFRDLCVDIDLLIEFVDYFMMMNIAFEDFIKFINYVYKVYGDFVFEDDLVIYASIDDYLDHCLSRNPVSVHNNYAVKLDKKEYLGYYNLTRLKAAIKRAENTFITGDGALIVID